MGALVRDWELDGALGSAHRVRRVWSDKCGYKEYA